jgi:hypothetical protein
VETAILFSEEYANLDLKLPEKRKELAIAAAATPNTLCVCPAILTIKPIS